ncbi:MAG TPA: SDR family NAD(P)-dependent oxidoreductase, partial [Rummeliibacillus sp.]|nr:SDR family NAD(P)-dependent oxidoreductase [Rummeliibacillus sp.]
MDDFIKKYGPWAVITGATSGMGYQFAHKLAEKGFHLVLVAREDGTLIQTKEMIRNRYNVQVKTVVTDLSTPNSISEIEKITQTLEVGLLINNAGYSITGEFHRENWENQSKLLETILKTPMALTHFCVNEMVKRGRGGVILVSSSVAYTSMPLWSVYSAGKAALLNFGESISQELKKYNVDV